MNRFLIVILSVALLAIAVQAYAGVGAKQAQYDGGTIAKVPKQMKGKLITGNRNLRIDPVAQTAAVAVCGSSLGPWKEPRTSKPEVLATGSGVEKVVFSLGNQHCASIGIFGESADTKKMLSTFKFIGPAGNAEFRSFKTGNHGQWFSDRGSFQDENAHGQEGIVRGCQLATPSVDGDRPNVHVAVASKSSYNVAEYPESHSTLSLDFRRPGFRNAESE